MPFLAWELPLFGINTRSGTCARLCSSHANVNTVVFTGSMCYIKHCCNYSCLLHQQVMQGADSHEGYMQALQKDCLVDYVGNNVNTFYYYVMCRTRRMWLLYDYHSVGSQLFYFVTRGYKTQKTQTINVCRTWQK